MAATLPPPRDMTAYAMYPRLTERESTLIYDVETACPVHNDGEEILQGITYAKGWGDFTGMGIACVCVLDLMEQRFRVFDGRSLHLFQKLVRERETVVGWNNQTFDDRLL